MDSRARRDRGAALSLRVPQRLHLVTNDDVLARSDFLDRAFAALEVGGAECVLHLRAHAVPGARLWQLARELRSAADRAGAGLWINDRVDVALAVRSDGVQLGARSMPVKDARRLLGRSCWVGRSIHRVEEAAAADADVLVLGNVYATLSHPERPPLGPETVRRAASFRRPILAIGGITPARVAEVVDAGAWGVAVVSGVWQDDDPAGAARNYLQALETAASRS